MEPPFTKNRLTALLFDCLSLGSPVGRLIVCLLGMGVLTFVDIGSLGLPDFCLWEKLVGYCPADGTMRALNALLKGKLLLAIEYNKNVLLTTPIITGIVLSDLIEIYRRITGGQKIKSERRN